jgi:ABC-type nitrate/sulfonate/bicarbonate transport system substrate-binding protein
MLTAVVLAPGLNVPGLALAPAVAQERSEFNLSRQPGLVYLPNQVMEDGKLVEKQAEKLGLKDLKVNYLPFTSGGVSTDTLLAGQVDELIAKDPKAAIAAYIRVTKDKGTPEDLLDVVTRKGSL